MSQEIEEAVSSSWYEEDPQEEQDISLKEYDITATPNDFNIKTLFEFIQSGALKIPGFQRNYVWDIKRASKLIESVILGLPVPQMFWYEEKRNSFLVIDGQQRLMSVYYFMKQRFPRNEKRTELRRIFDENGCIPDEIFADNNYFRPFDLHLPAAASNQPNGLNDLNYETLDGYKTSFDLRPIRSIIIKQNIPAEDDSSIYEIFNRLNSGGMNLTSQEVRASLYHSEFYSMLATINLDSRWRNLLGEEQPDLHLKDLEIILRGFAMLIEGPDYSPSMVKFLNRFSKNSKGFSAREVRYLHDLFIQFLDGCSNLTYHAFYGKTTGKFSVLLFEAVFAEVCRSAYDSKSLDVPSLEMTHLERLRNDKEFLEATQSNTTSTANVTLRLNRAHEILL